MRKAIALASAVVLGGVLGAPAFADCQADIKTTEDAAAKITNVKQKTEVEKHITMAKSELAKANEKACSEHVAAANAAAKSKPDMKP